VSPVRSILVINVARIGDTLLVTPALRALAAKWPGAAITFLGHPKRVEVMQHLPFLAATGPISKHRARWLGWLSGHRWDLGLVYGFDRALVSYALRATRDVVAFRQGRPALDSRLLRCVEPPPFQSDHAVPMRLSLTRSLGVPDAGLRLSYTVTPEERAAARTLLSQKGLRDTRPLIGLQVRAFPTKAWRDWADRAFRRALPAHRGALAGRAFPALRRRRRPFTHAGAVGPVAGPRELARGGARSARERGGDERAASLHRPGQRPDPT
jgi:heptosyltransferase-3